MRVSVADCAGCCTSWKCRRLGNAFGSFLLGAFLFLVVAPPSLATSTGLWVEVSFNGEVVEVHTGAPIGWFCKIRVDQVIHGTIDCSYVEIWPVHWVSAEGQLYEPPTEGDRVEFFGEVGKAPEVVRCALRLSEPSHYLKKTAGGTPQASCIDTVITGKVISDVAYSPHRRFSLRINDVIKNDSNAPSIATGNSILVVFSSALDHVVGPLRVGDCVRIGGTWGKGAAQEVPGLRCDPATCRDHSLEEVACSSIAEIRFLGTVTEPDNQMLDDAFDCKVRIKEVLEKPSEIVVNQGDEVLVHMWIWCGLWQGGLTDQPGGSIIPEGWNPVQGDSVEVYGRLSEEYTSIPGHSPSSRSVDLCGSDGYYIMQLSGEGDRDGDGLPDWKEEIAGTDPDDPDSDDDGLSDGQELNGWSVGDLPVYDASSNGNLPLTALVGYLNVDGTWGGGWDLYPEDFDGDGDHDLQFPLFPPPYLERDINGDGVCDLEDEAAICYLTPTIVKTDPNNEDTDGDLRIDANDPFPTTYVSKWEICVEGIKNLYGVQRYNGPARSVQTCLQAWYTYGYAMDPLQAYEVSDPKQVNLRYDYDGDGISLVAETLFETLPGLERQPGGEFFDVNPVEQALDTDKDGIDDLSEILLQLNPNTYIYQHKKLAFVEIAPIDSKLGVAGTVYVDIDDALGSSLDGKADPSWVTLWIGTSVSLGKSILPFIDGGFTYVPVSVSTEDDNSLPSGWNLQLAVFDTSGSFHFNPAFAVSYDVQVAKFDVRRDVFDALGLDALRGRITPFFPFLHESEFRNWLMDALEGIAQGEYPEGVRPAEFTGTESGFVVTAVCPVDIAVTDPEGRHITRSESTIPGATYVEADLDGDDDPDDRITIPYRVVGDYQIRVFPEPRAMRADSYTLSVWAGGETTILDDDVLVQDVPESPYIVNLSEDGLIHTEEPVSTTDSGRSLGAGAIAVLVVGSLGFVAGCVWGFRYFRSRTGSGGKSSGTIWLK